MKNILDNIESIREQFPALKKMQDGKPVVFFDGPAGTQVPQSVIDAMSRYMIECNANHGGPFLTSRESDEWMHEAHQAFADFVGASDPDEIIFGQNMTSLTFAFSRALAKTWTAGDEIVVTRLDHDANVSPWVLAAEDAGVTVRYVEFNHDDYTLDLPQFESCLNEKTKLVAIGAASNATGGINPIKHISQMAHQLGAFVFVDAVHYGPHGLIDVADWDCDFLCCSAYKFFGPHIGIMWGRRHLLESIEAYKVRPADNSLPGKWMTGTQSHESIAGGMACVDYICQLTAAGPVKNRREALKESFAAIESYERELAKYFLERMSEINGLQVFGITDEAHFDRRFATFSITHPAISSTDIAQRLAELGIFVWHGNYYALQFTESLGLEPDGMVRVGLVHYNTEQEIDRLHQALRQILPIAATSSQP